MRPPFARRAMLVLALVALLFTLDAAVDASIPPSLLAALVVAGAGFAWLLAWITERFVSGGLRSRITAILALNVLGVVPVAVMLPVISSLSDPGLALLATRATIIWLLCVVVWTTAILVAGGHAFAHSSYTRRPRGLVPLSRVAARQYHATPHPRGDERARISA